MQESKFGSLASFGFCFGLWGLPMCQMWAGRKIKKCALVKIKNTEGATKGAG
jgi:hypothetical protein